MTERRKIQGDDFPNHIFQDCVIVVTQPIAKTSNAFPILIGHPLLCLVLKPKRYFSDPLKTSLYGIRGLFVLLERGPAYTRYVSVNFIDVRYEIFQPAYLLFSRHEGDLDQLRLEGRACALALPLRLRAIPKPRAARLL